MGGFFVVKGFAKEFQRDRESNLYQLLQELQGRGIPRLAHSSVVLYDHPHRQHGLVLEWAGKDLDAPDRSYSTPSLSVMGQLREIISEMHRLGVAHGDIATRNVAWLQKTGQISVLDLGEARTLKELGPSEFARMCQADMTDVEEVLAEIDERGDGVGGLLASV